MTDDYEFEDAPVAGSAVEQQECKPKSDFWKMIEEVADLRKNIPPERRAMSGFRRVIRSNVIPGVECKSILEPIVFNEDLDLGEDDPVKRTAAGID